MTTSPMNLHLLPEEMVALAEILESPEALAKFVSSDTHCRVAAYVAGNCRSAAALKGLVTESDTTKTRRCSVCSGKGGVAYKDPNDETKTIIAHPRCLAMKERP